MGIVKVNGNGGERERTSVAGVGAVMAVTEDWSRAIRGWGASGFCITIYDDASRVAVIADRGPGKSTCLRNKSDEHFQRFGFGYVA